MSNKKKPLDGLFAQLQDIKDGSGKLLNTVLFSKNGNPSSSSRSRTPCSSMPRTQFSISPSPTC